MLKYLIDIPNVLLQMDEAVQLITIFLIVYMYINVWSLNRENFENVPKIYILVCCKPIKHQKWVKSERNKIQMEFHLPKRYSQNEL